MKVWKYNRFLPAEIAWHAENACYNQLKYVKSKLQEACKHLMLRISNQISIPGSEIEFSAIRAQGAGGQNVNKVSSAVHLRFDVRASSLPDFYKERLLSLHVQSLTRDGVIVIKAQKSRSQKKNREAALTRLQELINSVAVTRKKRKATKPTRGSKQKRFDRKRKRGQLKVLRGKVEFYRDII